MSNDTITSNRKIELKSLETLPEGVILDGGYEVLVLSGGGKKGITQLGFLHSMITQNIVDFTKINGYVGTSVGAIICFLLCINYLPIEILTYICAANNIDSNMQMNIFNIINNFGIYTKCAIFEIIEKMTIDKIGFIPTMADLYRLYNKHFICVTHNLSANMIDEPETVYIDYISHPNLSCIEAIKMSSNIPLVFGKHIYNKGYYVDGALSDNYPISYAYKKFPDKKIIALYVDKPHTVINDDMKVSFIDYMRSLILVSYRMNSAKSCKFTSRNVHSIKMIVDEGDDLRFDVTPAKSFQLFSIGYQCCIKLLEDRPVKVKLKMD